MKKLTGLLLLFCWGGVATAQTNTTQGAYVGTGGSYNSLFGYYAGNQVTGSFNTGVGAFSLRNTVGGYHNTSLGAYSLNSNTVGAKNVAVGYEALKYNTVAFENVAVGYRALKNSTDGYLNTAVGHESLLNNTTGDLNTAIGHSALLSNTVGELNTGTGYHSLRMNVSGECNTADGASALSVNTTGSDNTAIGCDALRKNTTGNYNTAIGSESMYNNTTGSYNTAIGYASMHAGNYSYSVALGTYSHITASQQVRVGSLLANSIGGYQNWTNVSDGRFKREVQEDVFGLDFIKKLRPVSYYIDRESVKNFLGLELEDEAINNNKQYQTGFIAQEVEATAKELGFEHFGGVDAPANENSHYGLRYAEFVVPLVKSVQELSQQNERQTTTIEDLKALIAAQQTQINDLLEAKNTNLNTATISSQSKAVLYQNAPNPFTHETQIKLFVPEEVKQAFIQVCTIDGKQLFVKEVTGRSETSVMLEAGDLSAGIYMYTLVVDHEIVASKRMMLTK